MKRYFHLWLVFVLFFSFSGCMKKGGLIFGDNDEKNVVLLKKVWIMPFPVSGETGLSIKFGKLLEKSFEAEKSIFLVNAHMADFKGLPEKLPLLPGGRINNAALSGIAEEAGIQAVGVFSAVDMTFEEKYTEAFFLSKHRWFAKAFFSFSIYDAETASKLGDFFVEEKVKISQDDYELYMKSPEKVSEPLVTELLSQASSSITEKALTGLSKTSWKGFVTEVKGKKAIISSGSETGIKPGDSLDILNQGEIFEGRDGFKYRIPGDTIGRITIDKSEKYGSEAEIPSGLSVSKGMALRPVEIKD